MGYTREYLVFMIREAAEMMEMDERFNEVGRDEWVWLKQAQDIVAQADDPEDFDFPNAGLCAEIPSGMAPMECVLSDVFEPNIAGMSMGEHWFPPSPPAPPAWPYDGTIPANGGQTILDEPKGGWKFVNIPVTITVTGEPEKKHESIDDILFAPVTPTAPKLG